MQRRRRRAAPIGERPTYERQQTLSSPVEGGGVCLLYFASKGRAGELGELLCNLKSGGLVWLTRIELGNRLLYTTALGPLSGATPEEREKVRGRTLPGLSLPTKYLFDAQQFWPSNSSLRIEFANRGTRIATVLATVLSNPVRDWIEQP